MSVMAVVLLVIGLGLLVSGAEALVRGASRLALTLGISPLVIGLTVVAFGTSAPEMAVSAVASLHGQADIALGNVIGSNIFNVLFILGIAALITPLIVNQQLIRLDVPLMIGASVLAWLLAADGRLGRLDGALLLSAVILYTGFLLWQSRRDNQARTTATRDTGGQADKSETTTPGGWARNLGLVGGGLVMLVVGSRLLVTGAVAMAQWFGVSELVIGLTIVAAGTSLPEVATSVVAGLRGERDIAVGNVVGSNLFNLLAVLGIAGLVAPGGVTVAEHVRYVDMLVMVAVAVACLPIFFTGHLIARWEGLLLLAYYVAYVLFLVLTAQQSDWLALFNQSMLLFALPLTGVTLALLVVRSWRVAQRAPA